MLHRRTALEDFANPLEVMLPALTLLQSHVGRTICFTYTQAREDEGLNAFDYDFALPDGRFVVEASEAVALDGHNTLTPTGVWLLSVTYWGRTFRRRSSYFALKGDVAALTRAALEAAHPLFST